MVRGDNEGGKLRGKGGDGGGRRERGGGREVGELGLYLECYDRQIHNGICLRVPLRCKLHRFET